ncbi:hypothetical protein BDR03DRAFT_969972 [Suillus americanus]|nr:hypothetical protein BDR03DRAFT_969972 [Suillus americanus]
MRSASTTDSILRIQQYLQRASSPTGCTRAQATHPRRKRQAQVEALFNANSGLARLLPGGMVQFAQMMADVPDEALDDMLLGFLVGAREWQTRMKARKKMKRKMRRKMRTRTVYYCELLFDVWFEGADVIVSADEFESAYRDSDIMASTSSLELRELAEL